MFRNVAQRIEEKQMIMVIWYNFTMHQETSEEFKTVFTIPVLS